MRNYNDHGKRELIPDIIKLQIVFVLILSVREFY